VPVVDPADERWAGRAYLRASQMARSPPGVHMTVAPSGPMTDHDSCAGSLGHETAVAPKDSDSPRNEMNEPR
jgi:hypothetical protein